MKRVPVGGRAYVYVPPFYIPVDQDWARFGRLLWTRARSFMEARQTSSIGSILPTRFLKLLRVLRLLAVHALGRMGVGHVPGIPTFRREDELSFVLRSLLGGYKLFNLGRHEVDTVLPDAWTATQCDLFIERRLALQGAPPVPAVLAVAEDHRSYTESYVNLPPLAPIAGGLDASWNTYRIVFGALITAFPPRHVEALPYVTSRLNRIRTRLLELQVKGMSSEAVTLIGAFCDDTFERVATHLPATLPLVLSHGDLHERNILVGGASPMVIDWDTYDFRFAPTDVWHVLFRCYSENGWPASRVADMFSSVIGDLSERTERETGPRTALRVDPSLNQSLLWVEGDPGASRSIYYLETVARLLYEKRFDEPKRAEVSLQRIRRDVEVFLQYETALCRHQAEGRSPLMAYQKMKTTGTS